MACKHEIIAGHSILEICNLEKLILSHDRWNMLLIVNFEATVGIFFDEKSITFPKLLVES